MDQADGVGLGGVGRGGAGYRHVDSAATARANRVWWDGEATAYYAAHGAFLGDDDLVWGPEGLREAEAGLLGDVRGADVLEVGCGAAQGSRWLSSAGARAVGIDLSAAMLRQSRALDTAALDTAAATAVVQADAVRLPFAAASFDVACSAYGALPFVGNSAAVMAEVARVLRPGGRWVFSLTHPVRWMFPDDPGPGGLRVGFSYFDRTPYVEDDAHGAVLYAEHHRTLGDRVRELVAAGFVLDDLVEPEWPDGHRQVWGGWSPERGRLLPGTAIFCCRLA